MLVGEELLALREKGEKGCWTDVLLTYTLR